MTAPDFLIIGGGVIGLNLALETKRRFADSYVLLIEKERQCGLHASGRNSGVLHAGFYYTADSFKARFTRDGNREMTAYCRERGLQLNACGKVVVARNAAELTGLDELVRRAQLNGVTVETVTADEARKIEPRVRTYERALFSPTTSSINPTEVVSAMLEDASRAGIELRTGTRYLARQGSRIVTTRGALSPGYVINAAGLYADKVARDFGFSEHYRILPFKGFYLYGDDGLEPLRTNVYPVPDLRNPFLGVHFTVTVDGRIKIGPTATPALWREHYGGWQNFRLADCVEVVLRGASLFMNNDFGFRRLAAKELGKHSRRRLTRLASQLVSGVHAKHYRLWGKPGIRAQLLDVKRRQLEMDFRYEGDEKSFHVLNAVSPAFTCAIPLSRYLVNRVESLAS